MADALCGLNGWNQCCLAVPVLEVALKHRQLDTIAFFLKSRESGESCHIGHIGHIHLICSDNLIDHVATLVFIATFILKLC